MEPVLSIYVDAMGVYFWENVIIDFDDARHKNDEDFGISHNRQMDIENFYDILFAYGHDRVFETYLVIYNKELIDILTTEFKN